MGTGSTDIDITQNIKMIEALKSQLLTDVADLYACMLKTDGKSVGERSDIAADLIIITYLLSQKIGISYDSLDMRIVSRIKAGVLDDANSVVWQQELKLLLSHFAARR